MMKFENVVSGMKVLVKDKQPNTKFGRRIDKGRFGGKIATVILTEETCYRGLTVHVKMDDGTELFCGSSSLWFSHKDLKKVKEEVK